MRHWPVFNSPTWSVPRGEQADGHTCLLKFTLEQPLATTGPISTVPQKQTYIQILPLQPHSISRITQKIVAQWRDPTDGCLLVDAHFLQEGSNIFPSCFRCRNRNLRRKVTRETCFGILAVVRDARVALINIYKMPLCLSKIFTWFVGQWRRLKHFPCFDFDRTRRVGKVMLSTDKV